MRHSMINTDFNINEISLIKYKPGKGSLFMPI